MKKIPKRINFIIFILSLFFIIQDSIIFSKDKISMRKKLGPEINSPYADLAPSVSADGNTMIFQSKRPGGSGGFDLWITHRNDGKWEKPVNLLGLNSSKFDGFGTISSNSLAIYFTSNRKKSGNDNMDIYVSYFLMGYWAPAEKVKVINSDTYDGMPVLSFDGKILYFSSNRVGGHGGFDLYYCKLQPDGEWGDPKNMGPAINSEDDERNPHVPHDDSVLYFSSNRPGGLGGFDLYFSQKLDLDAWEPPVNIGIPINGSDDQFDFTMPATGEYLYTSSRKNSQNKENIYKYAVPQWLKPVPVVIITGHVYDNETRKPIVSDINIFRQRHKKFKKLLSKSSEENTGSYIAILKTGFKYRITYSSSSYYSYHIDLSLRHNTAILKQEKEIFLVPILIGSKLLKNIVYFQLGKAELTDESLIALEKLITILKDNQNLRIKIAAYSDPRGITKKNWKLSRKRAQKIKDYLVFRGIDGGRLVAEGKGPIGKKIKNSVFINYKQFLKLQRTRRADFIIIP